MRIISLVVENKSWSLLCSGNRVLRQTAILLIAALSFLLAPHSLAADSAKPTLPPVPARSIPDRYDPLPNPRAVVTFGKARFTVLTPQLIRMEWAGDGKFEDHASFVFLQRNLPVPKFTQNKDNHGSETGLTIHTAALNLTYSPDPRESGEFTARNLSVALTVDGKSVSWHPGLEDTGNLMGTTRTLDGALGSKTKEPIGPGLISRDGWVVVDDSTRPLFDSADFSFTQGEASPWPWLLLRPEGPRQDLYFFGYGHDYKQALGDFVKVAGRIPLPPRFAFGAWWSRYWAYSDQEFNEIVRGFHENNTPLDVLVIDMDWHPTFGENFWNHQQDQSGHYLGWSGYSWNKILFPDPDQFLKHLHEEGLKATLNMHPASGVQPWEDRYPEMARAMGIDPATKQYVPFDITNKKFARNYFDIMHHPLEKQGIDFWWLDWQQEADTKTPGVNPTWWLNYVHFTDQEREGKRPLLFHRWGGLGNHRYQIGFSGDTVSQWESLAFQPGFTAQAANVGYAYWSHDIGGHMPGVIDPELYTRWIQFGAFSPILRTHTTKNPDAERRIWAYPEPYSAILRDGFQLRYALLPYIYTEARRTYDTGIAFLRPLYYDWPEADEAYTFKNEYLFGENMIAAPVTSAVDPANALASEDIWLPRGDWFEWPTGRHLTGPVQLKRNFSIEQIPVYLRAGAIVPMAPKMLSTDEKPVDPLIVNVFPLEDQQKSTYTLYADSGNSRAYQTGEASRTLLSAQRAGSLLTVKIEAASGTYPGMQHQRSYELRLPGGWPPQSVMVNGRPLVHVTFDGKPGWSFEGNTLTTIVRTASFALTEPVTIAVQRSPALVTRDAELDGFAGAMTRLRQTYDALNQNWSLGWSPDALIEAMQTGDRLGYRPETASTELGRFRQQLLPQAIQQVNELGKGLTADQKKELAERGGGFAISQSIDKKISDYNARVARASSILRTLEPGQ
jgi:alpha-glucosidase (family GH31 glycosyl hydrolase)